MSRRPESNQRKGSLWDSRSTNTLPAMNLERIVGIEPTTNSLEGWHSTSELYPQYWWVVVVTLHSPKDRFYRPTAETTGFNHPKLYSISRTLLFSSTARIRLSGFCLCNCSIAWRMYCESLMTVLYVLQTPPESCTCIYAFSISLSFQQSYTILKEQCQEEIWYG